MSSQIDWKAEIFTFEDLATRRTQKRSFFFLVSKGKLRKKKLNIIFVRSFVELLQISLLHKAVSTYSILTVFLQYSCLPGNAALVVYSSNLEWKLKELSAVTTLDIIKRNWFSQTEIVSDFSDFSTSTHYAWHSRSEVARSVKKSIDKTHWTDRKKNLFAFSWKFAKICRRNWKVQFFA